MTPALWLALALTAGPSTTAPTTTTTTTTTTATTAPATTAPAAAAPLARGAVQPSSPRTQALVVLSAGAGFGVVSAVAFSIGLDAERELRASVHGEQAADDLVNRRTAAAWVAWPAALLSAAGVGGGAAWLALQGDGEGP